MSIINIIDTKIVWMCTVLHHSCMLIRTDIFIPKYKNKYDNSSDRI